MEWAARQQGCPAHATGKNNIAVPGDARRAWRDPLTRTPRLLHSGTTAAPHEHFHDTGSGKSTPEAAGLLDPELASGVKKGYRFALEDRGMAAYATALLQRFSARPAAELIVPIKPEWFTSIKDRNQPQLEIPRCTRKQRGADVRT
jgi:hypothetical protein